MTPGKDQEKEASYDEHSRKDQQLTAAGTGNKGADREGNRTHRIVLSDTRPSDRFRIWQYSSSISTRNCLENR